MLETRARTGKRDRTRADPVCFAEQYGWWLTRLKNLRCTKKTETRGFVYRLNVKQLGDQESRFPTGKKNHGEKKKKKDKKKEKMGVLFVGKKKPRGDASTAQRGDKVRPNQRVGTTPKVRGRRKI